MRRMWAFLLLLLPLLLLLAACGPGGAPEEAETGHLIYYLAESGQRGADAIRASSEQLDVAEDAALQQRAAAVVERMLQGSAVDQELVSPLPDGVQLLSLEIRDRRAHVDFSSGFDQIGGVDLMLADYCLVLSLTALEGIQSVAITVRGRSVVQQPKQVFFERDVRLFSMEDMMQTVEATLYFQDESGALVGEDRVLEIYEGETVAEKLMGELLSGPESRELRAVIPPELAVSSVRVDSGVCYVNFPAEFMYHLPPEEDRQQMILWSLADSLYSLKAVEEIRILADGQELDMFGAVPAQSVSARPQG